MTEREFDRLKTAVEGLSPDFKEAAVARAIVMFNMDLDNIYDLVANMKDKGSTPEDAPGNHNGV